MVKERKDEYSFPAGQEKRDPKGMLDKGVAKLVSRKLLVWGTATVALFSGAVPAEQWVEICLLYIGSQAAVDIVSAYKGS
tara:strand:+ start:1467 stop:1706 length:240 start_codon:yes stop_codon:yes gene_type:complete